MYPWGNSPAPIEPQDQDTTAAYATYGCMGDGSIYGSCALSDILPAGSKPLGVGRYGQLDLAGSMSEWALDWHNPYPAICNNCASIVSGTARVLRGGDWIDSAISLRTTRRVNVSDVRNHRIGFRCARTL